MRGVLAALAGLALGAQLLVPAPVAAESASPSPSGVDQPPTVEPAVVTVVVHAAGQLAPGWNLALAVEGGAANKASLSTDDNGRAVFEVVPNAASASVTLTEAVQKDFAVTGGNCRDVGLDIKVGERTGAVLTFNAKPDHAYKCTFQNDSTLAGIAVYSLIDADGNLDTDDADFAKWDLTAVAADEGSTTSVQDVSDEGANYVDVSVAEGHDAATVLLTEAARDGFRLGQASCWGDSGDEIDSSVSGWTVSLDIQPGAHAECYLVNVPTNVPHESTKPDKTPKPTGQVEGVTPPTTDTGSSGVVAPSTSWMLVPLLLAGLIGVTLTLVPRRRR